VTVSSFKKAPDFTNAVLCASASLPASDILHPAKDLPEKHDN
jgi:hypothetical protein